MELTDFRNEILNEAHLNAFANGTSAREEFFARYALELYEAEVFEDLVQQLSYEGVGSRNRKLQIDGYYYSELENTLSILVCPFADSNELHSLTSSEAEVFFKRARGFYEDACSGFIEKNSEESSPGYGLAIEIRKHYNNIPKLKFYLLTDMLMSNRIREIPNVSIGKSIAEFHIWDISRLHDLVQSKSGKEDIIINLNEFTESGIPCLEAGRNEEYEAYLCNIPGLVLAKLYLKYGSRLLEGNVRSFLSAKGKINKEIRNTILNNPEMFFAYNNGIAATASDVKVEYGKSCPYITEIQSLQIVNGGQTTVSLANAIQIDKDKSNNLVDIYVPMKLSVVSPEKAMDLIPNIAKYANKQNKVSDADFFSNHPFHIRIEQLSRSVIAPAVEGNQYGTCWYYERARGQYKQAQAGLSPSKKKEFLMKNPKSQMFKKTELAKYYNIYRQFPYLVCLGYEKNFQKFAEWANAEWEKEQTVFNENFFKKIVCLKILYDYTDRFIMRAPWASKAHSSKASFVTYTLSYLFYSIEVLYPNMVLDFRTIWNKQKLPSVLELAINQIAKLMYDHLNAPDRQIELISEYAKKELCWKKAKMLSIEFLDEFAFVLCDKDDELYEQRIACKEQKQRNDESLMIQVVNYGADNWERVLEWGRMNHLLSPNEISLLKAAIAIRLGKPPTDKQCVRIIQILEKVRQDGYPD